MRIGYVIYPVLTLGYGKRIGIWLCGCSKNCKDCMSPELREKGNGKEVQVVNLIYEIQKWAKEADGVTISGGEPFDQSRELVELVKGLNKSHLDDILIYTGYRIDQLETDANSRYCIDNAAAVIDGEFRSELNDGKGIRGSVNQSIRVNKYPERYQNIFVSKRRQQSILLNDKMIVIGIPDIEDK